MERPRNAPPPLEISTVVYPQEGHPVEKTAAEAIASRFGAKASAAAVPVGDAFNVSLGVRGWHEESGQEDATPWIRLRCSEKGDGMLVSDEPAFLYAAVRMLDEIDPVVLARGVSVTPAFALNRVLWDGTLTQYWRTARKFDMEHHIRAMAESGFTHLEVNALQAAMAMEEVAPTEFYAQFYNYCAGFNHFVETPLTAGLWPSQYLEANLRRLQKIADLGRKYGLKPGVVFFEPRTLPERFFQRYPTLRGARVDHPFRSRIPRYTLAQDHPVTRRHYRECVLKLMEVVPDLDYMSIWSNDSGAGFEHTASLYVGRNGGPYMIREWRSHAKVAEAAAGSIVRYLELLRDSAREVNPAFKVFFRIEPYKVEHDAIVAGLGNGLDLEAPSLLVHGYDLPYSHPKYPDQRGVAGTLLHTDFDDAEAEKLAALRKQGIEPALHYSASSCWNHEPLIGIPFPRALHKKLCALRKLGARRVSGFGGLLNTRQTPWWPNPEVIRAAQFTPERSIEDILGELANRWVGKANAAALVGAWDAIEEAISWQPVVPLFCAFGFVWQRTWDRPMVPDIESIPERDRQYYERFMCVQPNNPGRVDYGRDVLFDLITRESGERMAAAFDSNCIPRVKRVKELLESLVESSGGAARAVFVDLRDRVAAYLHWTTALRNVCAWVRDVYGYLESSDAEQKKRHSEALQRTIDLEMENTRGLLALWENSSTEFMVVSDIGETTYIYGENFGEHLRRKLALMEMYRNSEPYIDRDIIWRIEGLVDWPEGKPRR